MSDLGSLGRRESRSLLTSIALIRAAMADPYDIRPALERLLEQPLALGPPEEAWESAMGVLASVTLMAGLLLEDLAYGLGVDPDSWFTRFDVLVGPAGVLRPV